MQQLIDEPVLTLLLLVGILLAFALHEMGHAWGHDHGDARMSSEWGWIREAMRHSR